MLNFDEKLAKRLKKVESWGDLIDIADTLDADNYKKISLLKRVFKIVSLDNETFECTYSHDLLYNFGLFNLGKELIYERMLIINKLLNFHGVEEYQRFMYLQAGDIYNTTLMHDNLLKSWHIGTIGDVMEVYGHYFDESRQNSEE